MGRPPLRLHEFRSMAAAAVLILIGMLATVGKPALAQTLPGTAWGTLVGGTEIEASNDKLPRSAAFGAASFGILADPFDHRRKFTISLRFLAANGDSVELVLQTKDEMFPELGTMKSEPPGSSADAAAGNVVTGWVRRQRGSELALYSTGRWQDSVVLAKDGTDGIRGHISVIGAGLTPDPVHKGGEKWHFLGFEGEFRAVRSHR